eukprot:Gb_37586 [translate_table: standard]
MQAAAGHQRTGGAEVASSSRRGQPLPMPKPRTPPSYPDIHGKYRRQAELNRLTQEISLLESGVHIPVKSKSIHKERASVIHHLYQFTLEPQGISNEMCRVYACSGDKNPLRQLLLLILDGTDFKPFGAVAVLGEAFLMALKSHKWHNIQEDHTSEYNCGTTSKEGNNVQNNNSNSSKAEADMKAVFNSQVKCLQATSYRSPRFQIQADYD